MSRKDIDYFLAPARQATKAANWEEAELLWGEAKKALSKNSPVEVFQRLAQARNQLGKFDLVNQTIDEGLVVHKGDPVLLALAVDLLPPNTSDTERIQQYQELIGKLKDKTPEKSWLKLSGLYHANGRTEEARDLLDLAIDHYNINSPAIIQRAINLAGNQQDWDAVLNVYKKMDAGGSLDDERTFLIVIEAYMAAKDFKSADKLTAQALIVAPDSILIKFAQAEVANELEDWQRSAPLWQSLQTVTNKTPSDRLNHIARLNNAIVKKIINIDKYKEKIADYESSEIKKDIAIATAFSAGYDQLKPHTYLSKNTDYLVFSDEQLEGLGIYKTYDLPKASDEKGQQLDPGRLIRYVKMHPHKLFKDYQVAVWIDASLVIVDDLNPMIEDFIKSGKAIGSTPHSMRSSVWEEFDTCLELKKDDPELIKKQRDFYKSEKVEIKGLSENGLLMFKIDHPDLSKAMELWWEQVITFSKRDQLSFGYALAKSKVDWHPLMQPPHSIRSHPALILCQHGVRHKALDSLVRLIK